MQCFLLGMAVDEVWSSKGIYGMNLRGVVSGGSPLVRMDAWHSMARADHAVPGPGLHHRHIRNIVKPLEIVL